MSEETETGLELSCGALSLVFDDRGGMTWRESESGRLLLRSSSRAMLWPVVKGGEASPVNMTIKQEGNAIVIRGCARGAGSSLGEWRVVFTPLPEENAVDVRCTFFAASELSLNRLELLPAGTELNFYDLFNYRNRHHTPSTAPELSLGGAGCETDTYSRDWQFAPHPSAVILRANELALFCGCLELPGSYGMFFAAADYRLRHWYLNYGTATHGLRLKAGEHFESPRVRFFLGRGKSPETLYHRHGDMLVREGLVPDPARKHREAWWREPLYCTWVDQCFQADAHVAESLQEQADAAAENPAVAALTETLVEEAVAVIERERLPFRTILLDDGWQVARGQWEPHPQRFPNLRALVDRLHARGFKVVVWWNWAEIEAKAEANPAHLLGGGALNRHGCRVRDYSLPATQNEYLRPLFRRLFSSEPGCFDLDGVKTDFLADKVHVDLPPHDPVWRGEESYFYHITRLFYDEMRKHKADAVHIGGAGHPWLAEWIDINRTYDVHNSNWREHEERARMLAATTPGCPVAYDFHIYEENLEEWFASARDIGSAVQIGNILWSKRDRFSPPRRANAAYWEKLRKELGTRSKIT